ncbi:MAG: hypothetical protein ACPGJV_16090 [Bacteriovoracaceae bacterium]
MIKYLKISLSVVFLVMMIGALVYKNLFDHSGENQLMAQMAELVFPAFMGFSFLMLILKKWEDRRENPREKLNKKDKEDFSNIGRPEDY